MSVKDFGIGISQEEVKKIFTPYFRTSEAQSQKMNVRGHGLGLSICK